MADPLEESGSLAPPRSNGELVFDAPWQSRAFGVTVALHEAGRLTWDDFRQRLVTELVGVNDASPETYWSAWLRATEAVIDDATLVPGSERRERLALYATRAADHDHDHDARPPGGGGALEEEGRGPEPHPAGRGSERGSR